MIEALDLDDLASSLPQGWRFVVGHVPHWYRSDAIPKHLRKKPFEAWVTNGEMIGTKAFIMESADAATPSEALAAALTLARVKAAKKQLETSQISGER